MWDTIMAQSPGETVSKDVALEAFAYVYKVAIPGVTLPNAVEGDDAPTSGTGVTRWVRGHWDELTPDQQAVIDRLTTPQPGDLTIPGQSSSPAGQAPFELAVARQLSPFGNVANLPSNDLIDAMKEDIATDITHVAQMLHTTAIAEGDWDLNVTDTSGGNALLLTLPLDIYKLTAHYMPCFITAYQGAWQGESLVTGMVGSRLHELLEHEVIHCYQNVVWGSTAKSYTIPKWITEGTAFYLAQMDTGEAEVILPNAWRTWFNAETPLTYRNYDAFGYYNLLAQKGRDLWSLMEPAWKAAAASAQPSDAFIAVLKGDDDDVRDAWAPSYLRQDEWADPWVTMGFGLPDDAQVTQHEITAVPGSGVTGSLPSRSNTVLDVTAAQGGEVVAVGTTGLASVHDETFNSALAFTQRKFCVEGDCICPQGTQLAGKHVADQTMTLPFVVALNAPADGSQYVVVSDSLSELCGAPNPTPPPPCTTGCPDSNGDPHMLTVNDYRYDFQAAGEFVLLRNADDSVEIQAREQPFGHREHGVATNTAVAARDNGHRVGIYASPFFGQLQVKVDGADVDASASTDLGAGASVHPIDMGIEVDFPDGSVLDALSVGLWGINAVVQPSDALRADGVGLLGPITPGNLGVPALPDGTQLPAAPDAHTRFQAVYGPFADAWRVTDASSLFDYEPGQSTATFTDRSFPSEADAAAQASFPPDAVAAGEAACVNVTDPELHPECVFDVAATGDAGFATEYESEQGLFDSGLKPSPSPSPGSSPALPSASLPTPNSSPGMHDALKVTDLANLTGAAVGPDDTVYLSIDDGQGNAQILAVDPHTATVLQSTSVRVSTDLHFAAGSLWAAGLNLDSNFQDCNVTRFDPSTLAVQATFPIACSFNYPGPKLVSSGDTVWVVDTSNYDLTSDSGAKLAQIDPSTNTPGQTVDLPTNYGGFTDSVGALFCRCGQGNSDIYRLLSGGTALEDLGNYTDLYPAGTGFWSTTQAGGSTAVYVNSGGGPAASVTLGSTDTLVGGDTGNVYVQREGDVNQPATQLLRQPADGSAAVPIANAPTWDSPADLDYTSFDYLTGNPTRFATPDGFVTMWIFQGSLYLQWAPLK
jgi:hypothetical protein